LPGRPLDFVLLSFIQKKKKKKEKKNKKEEEEEKESNDNFETSYM